MNIHIGRPGTWSEAEDAELARLWGEGWSASEIAARMEKNPSRNAVLGRVWRLALPARKTVFIAPKTKRAKNRSVPKERKPSLKKVRENAPTIDRDLIWHPLDSTTPVTLIDRKRTECVWPLDVHAPIGEKVVCGQPIWGSCVYCATHSKIAYVPAKARA